MAGAFAPADSTMRYWAIRRFVQAGYWDASALIDELSQSAMLTLPPPADGTIYLIGDLTIKQKSGYRTPVVHKIRSSRSFSSSCVNSSR
jgi:hypothetical protein